MTQDEKSPRLNSVSHDPSRLSVERFPALLDMTLNHLAQDCSEKKSLSRVSLTCRRWSRKLRPLLFKQLNLESTSDIHFLTAVLSSAASAWLASYIFRIALRSPPNIPNSFRLAPPAWKRLFQLLPNLNFLHLVVRYNTSDRSFPWKERPFLHNLPTLRRLKLDNFRFPSVSSVVRLLGDMPFLEGATLKGIEWGGSADLEHPPTHVPLLDHIQFLALNGCTDGAILSWVFAATSVRHLLRRRGDQNVTPVPTDVLTMVHLVHTFCAGSNPHIVYQNQKNNDGKIFQSHVWCHKRLNGILQTYIYSRRLWESA